MERLKNGIIKENSFLILFLILALGSLFLFSFAINNRSYQTECLDIQSDGYVTIKIWDYRKGVRYRLKQARKDAIHAILFSGISGGNGCITQPPILNTTEDKENFKTIEKGFFAKNGNWSMFTRSSETYNTSKNRLGIKTWKVYQLTISKNELRKYLEENKIIKSLNNGF